MIWRSFWGKDKGRMTKKNHFNSKVYLKAFEHVSGSKKCYSTNRISIKGKNHWSQIEVPISVSGLCYLTDFYTNVDADGLDRNTLELFFKQSFEDFWPTVVQKLVHLVNPIRAKEAYDRSSVFSEKEINTIITFIIVQYKRTPRTRDFFISSEIKIGEKEMKKLKRENPQASEDVIMQILLHETHLSFLEHPQDGTRDILRSLNWGLLINSTNTPWVTSDAPVLWLDEIKIDKSNAIFVPITPRIAMMIPINLAYDQGKIVLKYMDEKFVKDINTIYRD